MGPQRRKRAPSGAQVAGWLLVALATVPALRASQLGAAKRHARSEPDAKDFAPKLIHQPHSVQVPLARPHTVECPVEAQPEAEVKWFKDNQLVESEPTHLEQTGAELMFFQIGHQDAGDYHCRATNYLGSVASEPFKLLVQSTVRDPSIRLEPRVAEVADSAQGGDSSSANQVEFACKIPALAKWPRNRDDPAPTMTLAPRGADIVAWRRNGRKLAVVWLGAAAPASSSGDTLDEPGAETPSADAGNNGDHQPARHRFFARQVGAGEFLLTIARPQRAIDNNSTFTCAANPTILSQMLEEHEADSSPPSSNEELERESNEARLQFATSAIEHQQPPISGPKAPTDGPLATQTASGSRPTIGDHSDKVATNNSEKTTQLNATDSSTTPSQQQRTLAELLNDLMAVSRISLIMFSFLCLIALIVLLQLVFLRKRTRENRYMKHQYSGASAGCGSNSSGSGTSSALGGSLDCDPVLSSLLSRTLSAPSAANSLAGGATKKYRSYRDHMRKVAAVSSDLGACSDQLVHHQVASDFMDLGYSNQQRVIASSNHQLGEPFGNFARAQLALPNLYNQSLAARQQAQALLKQQRQANEHLKSLSNLATVAGGNQNSNQSNSSSSSSSNNNNNNNNNNCKQRSSRNSSMEALQGRQQQAQFHGSHLNLHNIEHGPHQVATNNFSVTDGNNLTGAAAPLETGTGLQLLSNSSWPPHLIQFASAAANRNQQQQFARLQQQSTSDEHYQLVSCSSSISPTSSVAGSSLNGRRDSAANDPQQQQRQQTTTNQSLDMRQQRNGQFVVNANTNQRNHNQQLDSSLTNHYSTIETNEEDEGRYEELEDGLARSTTAQLRCPSTATNLSSACGDSGSAISQSVASNDQRPPPLGNRFGSKRTTQHRARQSTNAGGGGSQGIGRFQDQLSPYAVSSICGNNANQPLPVPPPINSEAMQALDEQFDLAHLMMLDDCQQDPSVPFQDPPPPPPPPTSDCSTRKSSDRLVVYAANKQKRPK